MSMNRQDLAQALVGVIIRNLLKQREEVLANGERSGWKWDSALSTRLDAVDHALTWLGYFDKT